MRRLIPLFLSLSLLACSSRTETSATPPRQEKKAFISSIEAPKNSADALQEAYADIPKSAIMVLRWRAPNNLVGALQKAMVEFIPPGEMEDFIKKGTAELGMSPMEPDAASKLSGVELKRDLTAFLDDFNASPGLVFVVKATLTDKDIFLANIKRLLTKEQPTARFVDAEASGYSLSYVYDAKSEAEPQEVLYAVLAMKDNALTILIAPEGVALGSAEDDFKKSAMTYIETAVTASILQSALFQEMSKKADPLGDLFFFVDVNAAVAFSEKHKESTLDPEKKEIAMRLLAAFPGMASSLSATTRGLQWSSVAKLIPLSIDGARSMTPSKDAPPYGSIFPEDTLIFSRSSLNLLGLKDLVMSFIPKKDLASAEQGLAMASGVVGGYTGLNLESDILGAFTGHIAYTTDYSSLLPESTPKISMVMQLTSEVAGDKLLAALANLPEKLGNPSPIKVEEVFGEKLYSITAGPVEIAWGRCNDLLVFGLGAASVKSIYQRIKTPGTSFAEKSGSERAKNMVNAKSGGGLYFDAAAIAMLFAMISAQKVDEDPEVKEILSKVFAKLGTLVFQSDYDQETQQYFMVMELLFK